MLRHRGEFGTRWLAAMRPWFRRNTGDGERGERVLLFVRVCVGTNQQNGVRGQRRVHGIHNDGRTTTQIDQDGPNGEAIYFRNFKLVHGTHGHGLRVRARVHILFAAFRYALRKVPATLK